MLVPRDFFKRCISATLIIVGVLFCFFDVQPAGNQCHGHGGFLELAGPFCSAEFLNASSVIHLPASDGLLPSPLKLLLSVLGILFLTGWVRSRKLNFAQIRHRVRFLHPTLPRHGPENQRGYRPFVLSGCDP